MDKLDKNIDFKNHRGEYLTKIFSRIVRDIEVDFEWKLLKMIWVTPSSFVNIIFKDVDFERLEYLRIFVEGCRFSKTFLMILEEICL